MLEVVSSVTEWGKSYLALVSPWFFPLGIPMMPWGSSCSTLKVILETALVNVRCIFDGGSASQCLVRRCSDPHAGSDASLWRPAESAALI